MRNTVFEDIWRVIRDFWSFPIPFTTSPFTNLIICLICWLFVSGIQSFAEVYGIALLETTVVTHDLYRIIYSRY